MLSLILAQASNEIRDLWHPAIFLVWFFVSFGWLPVMKPFLHRLFSVGLIWGCVTGVWYIANPTPLHVSYPEYEFLAPITSIVIPAAIAIIALSWHESYSPAEIKPAWGWVIFITGFLTANCYFGATKNMVLSRLWSRGFHHFHVPGNTVLTIEHHLPAIGRPLYFIVFAIACWSLANRSQAGRLGRVVFTLGSCLVLAIFEHLRYHEAHWQPPSMAWYFVPGLATLVITLFLEIALAPREYRLPVDLDPNPTTS